ncbi:hypothetical protein BS47DRAFT_1350201, partial [Hydnum rufescens UP504]
PIRPFFTFPHWRQPVPTPDRETRCYTRDCNSSTIDIANASWDSSPLTPITNSQLGILGALPSSSVLPFEVLFVDNVRHASFQGALRQ